MSHVDLTLSAWLDLSDEAAGRTAAAIARSTDARHAGIGPHAYAGRTGRAAFFDRDGVRYALVPGGTVQLGHDADRFVPSARQLADFAEAVAEYHLTGPLNRFVAEATSPPRHVFLPARLVAVRSEETDVLLAADDEADVDDGDGEYDHAWLMAGTRSPRPATADSRRVGVRLRSRGHQPVPLGRRVSRGRTQRRSAPHPGTQPVRPGHRRRPVPGRVHHRPSRPVRRRRRLGIRGDYGSFLTWLTLAHRLPRSTPGGGRL